VFRNDGDYWTIKDRDTLRQLDDMKGFHYIAHLLRREGEGCWAIDLVAATDRRGDERREGIIDPASDGLSVVTDLGDAGAILDERAAGEYRGALEAIPQRLTLLKERLEEAERCNDLGGCEAARLEMEKALTDSHWLQHQLVVAGIGPNGKRRYPRKAASHLERARLLVTKGIKTALNKLHKAGLAALADHLRKQIKRGYECVYTPDPHHPIEWVLDPIPSSDADE
jgi:hypothetical protein